MVFTQGTKHMYMFAGWLYSAQQFIVKPIPENPKVKYFIGSMTINSILLKMAFGGHLGFDYFRLHSEYFPHTRIRLKRQTL